MPTLHIEHRITDYATWRGAFDSFAEARRDAGVVTERVQQPIDYDHYIVVHLDFGTEEQAVAFLQFLETVVWAIPENAPALDGRPRTLILDEATAR